MSTTFVQSNQVVGVNGQAYLYPDYIVGVVNGIAKQLNCLNMTIINSFWKIPYVVGTQVTKYTYEVAVNTSTPPTADSIKVLIIKDSSDQAEYELAIANTDNMAASSPPNQFAYLCDGLGGSLPVMPTATIPFPVIQYGPVSTDGTDNTFIFPFPSNPLGLKYSIPAPWFNGVAASPAYAPGSIVTAAQFVTWATSNWSGYGTWTSSGNIVTLVSSVSNVTKAGMQVALTPAAFCFNLTAYSTPAAVNQVKFGSGGTLLTIPGGAFMLTNDPTVLIAQLQKVMSAESTTYGTAVAHKLQVNTVYDTPKLYYNGSLVVSSSAGVCS